MKFDRRQLKNKAWIATLTTFARDDDCGNCHCEEPKGRRGNLGDALNLCIRKS